jgi:hypothetical protein
MALESRSLRGWGGDPREPGGCGTGMRAVAGGARRLLRGATPLECAIANGHRGVVRLLAKARTGRLLLRRPPGAKRQACERAL